MPKTGITDLCHGPLRLSPTRQTVTNPPPPSMHLLLYTDTVAAQSLTQNFGRLSRWLGATCQLPRAGTCPAGSALSAAAVCNLSLPPRLPPQPRLPAAVERWEVGKGGIAGLLEISRVLSWCSFKRTASWAKLPPGRPCLQGNRSDIGTMKTACTNKGYKAGLEQAPVNAAPPPTGAGRARSRQGSRPPAGAGRHRAADGGRRGGGSR